MVINMLMVVFLVMLQYAINAHARNVAQAAADEALQAAQAYDSTATAGRQAGNQMLDDLGALTNTTITVTRSAATVEVTVTGAAQQVIPLLPTQVTVQLRGPVEHFVGPRVHDFWRSE
jgi:hypothetical protein